MESKEALLARWKEEAQTVGACHACSTACLNLPLRGQTSKRGKRQRRHDQGCPNACMSAAVSLGMGPGANPSF